MNINTAMEDQPPVEQDLLRREDNCLPIEDWRAERKSRDSMDSASTAIRDLSNSHSNVNQSADATCGTATYRKGIFLGKGGFAHVHELIDISTNIVYAGKIIPKHRIAKPYHAEKIAREICIHRNLVHKNVVRLHHFFEDRLNAYIILENCSQKSLLHVLRHRKTLTEPESRYYLCQLVEGVKYIHSQKVIHRDLKPGNMFLNENMIVKIGDFGLATVDDGNNKMSICGTPNYMAPEVLKKLCPSYEADVWAIGCILYAMLVGKPPFETETVKGTYARIVTNKYALPLKLSVQAQNIIRQILQPLPESRLSLDRIINHDYIKCNFTPDTLSLIYCYIAPTFSKSMNRYKFSKTILQPSNLNQNSNIPKIATQRNTLLLKTTFKQKLSSVLCPEKSGRNKKVNNAASLYCKLANCLQNMPIQYGECPNPSLASSTPLFILKWIDYSNKYGFGFQLSDRSVGVLFNDNTTLLFNPDKSFVEYHDKSSKMSSYPLHSVPPSLHEMLALLKYFAQYMEEHLTVGGDVEAQSNISCNIPYMKRWVRTHAAIIMELSNGTLQINFFKDHTKIVVSGRKEHVLVTYINKERQNSSYWLHDIKEKGCDKSVRECLRFASAVLREFAELEEA